jgi:hypothetical protein
VALFEAGIVQTTSPGTISTPVWNPSGTSTTTYGALGSVPSTAILKDVTVINQGTVNVYLASGSVSLANIGTGILLPVGGQITIQGYSGTVGTAGTIWAQTSTINTTGAIAAGMASVPSVV